MHKRCAFILAIIAFFVILLAYLSEPPVLVHYDHTAGGDVRELIVYFSSNNSGLERHHYLTCSLSGDVAGYDQPLDHGLMVLGVSIKKLNTLKAYEARVSFVKNSDAPPYYATREDLISQLNGKDKVPCVVAEANYFSRDTKSEPFYIPAAEILSEIKL